MDELLRVFNDNVQNVFINKKGIERIAFEVATYLVHNYHNKTFGEVTYNYVRLSTEFHPKKDDFKAVDWLFVLNTLNFSLWAPKGESEWTVDGLTGYMALCAAIKRAIDERKPIWNPKYYSALSMADMKHIFRGDKGIHNTIPNISQRLVILHNVGKHLLEKYKGTFVRCIQLCKGDPQKLMDLLQDEFASYENEMIYSEQIVPLQSKAWILVADIWATFRDHQLNLDITTSKLSTILVDYRVFQVLNHFNAIVYSKNFLDKLQKENEMTHGSREDLEIRCCATIVISSIRTQMVEKIEYFAKSMPELQFKDFDCACLIDNFLWDYQQLHDEQLKKYPLCKISTEQY